MGHWLLHILGLDSASGTAYLAWSGVGSDISEVAILGALVSIYRRHACHVKGCPRIGRFPVAGTTFVVCRRHHPDDAPTHQDVIDAHHHALRRRSGEACERMHASPPEESP